jgi:uncharacterized membrane protein (UPF0127 family)
MRSSRRRLLASALALAAAFGCSAQNAGLPKAAAAIVRTDGVSVPIELEIADDDASRQTGLMNRKELADGKGMLFVFEIDQPLSFWMKNTLVPLTIAFIASDGRILELRDMQPLSLAPVNSARSARYALEAPQGWFGRAGVAPGDVLELPGYKSAR